MFMLYTVLVQINCQLEAKIFCQWRRLGFIQLCAVSVAVVVVFVEEAPLLLDVLRALLAPLRQLLLRLVCLFLFLKMKALMQVEEEQA